MDQEDDIIIQPIEKEMQRSYIDYSMSVIVGRALPDVRDGLKPVHRKILYAMNNLGLTYIHSHKKSATVVGEVLGKYHPHGDSVVYDQMVRMAQSFSLRYPLIDGQGNFGSVDGDSAAAMRYTEAKLSKVAGDLLTDLDKDTVDMVDNYDGSLKEPVVLPSMFPNLLVNGSDGIAVGMATKMPPHNLREVCDAIIYNIDNPNATVCDIMRYIKGPDFPTGGTIYGIDGIISAYNTGRGRIKIRANTHFEDIGNGRKRIIVDEIPYQVNKAMLIEQIADHVKNKDINGISDLRDESDRHGMRIVIDLHKDAIPNVVLENLFKKTNMQTTYGIINIALVGNKPSVLDLKSLITYYINHRQNVVSRRVKYDLLQAKKRFHILEALIKAINSLDDAIELIRKSDSPQKASKGLMGMLDIDENQAKSILDMKLQRLTSLEIGSIIYEHNSVSTIINDLENILSSDSRVLDIIKDELNDMKKSYGDDRRTHIDSAALDIDEEDLIPMEQIVITISNDNYIKRIPLSTYKKQSRGGVGLTAMQTKQEDHISSMFVASSHDYVMFITNHGRLYWLKGYKIPEGNRQSKGRPIVNFLPNLSKDEKVVNTICTADFSDSEYLVFCTKNGLLKKTSMCAYKNVRSKGVKAIKLDENDELIETDITHGNDQIIIASKNGLAIRFDEIDVRPTGRCTIGVKAMTLNYGDSVVSMAVVRPGDRLLTVSENGYGKISDVDSYRQTRRGGKGVITIKTDNRNGLVVGVKRVNIGGQLMLTSISGKIIRLNMNEVRETGRNAKGVRIMDLRNGDKIAAIESVISN